jgi:hypothetical protein
MLLQVWRKIWKSLMCGQAYVQQTLVVVVLVVATELSVLPVPIILGDIGKSEG